MQTSAESWAAGWDAVEGRARIGVRIAGLHCSVCTGTIEKALGRMDGVGQVAVSLTHEQALGDSAPGVIAPEQILSTLQDIGYELYDPRKLRPLEEEEAALVREGVRLLGAITASLAAIGLIATVTGIASVLVPLSVGVVLVPLSYVILRKAGRVTALAGAAAMGTPGAAALIARGTGGLPGWPPGWLAAGGGLARVAGGGGWGCVRGGVCGWGGGVGRGGGRGTCRWAPGSPSGRRRPPVTRWCRGRSTAPAPCWWRPPCRRQKASWPRWCGRWKTLAPSSPECCTWSTGCCGSTPRRC